MMAQKLVVFTMFLVSTLLPFDGLAQTYTSIADGDWDQPSTWNPAGPPTTGSTVVINTNVNLYTGMPITVNSITINDGGQLAFNGSGNLTVTTDFTINSSSIPRADNTDLYINVGGANLLIGGNLVSNSLDTGSGNCFIEANAGLLQVSGNVVFNATAGTTNQMVDQNVIQANGSATIDLKGNVNDNQQGNLQFNNNSVLSLSGSIQQYLPAPMYGTIKGLVINNTSGIPITIDPFNYKDCGACPVTTHSSVNVANNLDLQNGTLNTGQTMPASCATATNLKLGSTATITNSSGSIMGVISKLGNSAFTVPGNNGTVSGSMTISDIQGGAGNTEIRIEYVAAGSSNNTTTTGLDHVGTAEYWNISTTCGPTDPTSIDETFTWKDACQSGIKDLSAGGSQDLFMAFWNGSSWQPQSSTLSGSACVSGPPSESGNIFINNVTSFGLMGYGSKSNHNSLPITLASFTAKADDLTVDLKWETLSEINNCEFEIQRSDNGEEFITIGNLPGNGTTNKRNVYSYVDKPLRGDLFYYRLKQIDCDQQSSFSPVVVVNLSGRTDEEILCIPNPVNIGETLTFINEGSYLIYDNLGRLRASGEFYGLNTSNFEKGLYLVIDVNSQKSQRVIMK